MYGVVNHKANRDYCVSKCRDAGLLRNCTELMSYVYTGVLSPYELALLMAPVNGKLGSNRGYHKLIQATIRSVEGYMAHLEDINAVRDLAEEGQVVREINKIWGVSHRVVKNG